MKLPELARKAIESHFEGKEFFPGEKIEEKLSKPIATFVTITKRKTLRGCMGSLETHEPLWEDVRDNAINAAFFDPRFSPLKKQELKEIKIEVSVLSTPKKLKVKHSKFIPEKINRNMGLILKHGDARATFLPQVWEQIHNKIDFLEHLAKKAGLNKDAWMESELFYYTVKIQKEK